MAGNAGDKAVSNGQQLYIFTPESFYQLEGLTTLSSNLLALIAAFGREGLRLSNYRLAKLFNVERGTIIDNIARLKGRGYITDEGKNKQKHRLVASSVILTLLSSVKRQLGSGEITPEPVSKGNKTGVETTPINKESKENRSDATPLPVSGQPSLSPQKIISPEDRRKILENMPDSTFKRAVLARRR